MEARCKGDLVYQQFFLGQHRGLCDVEFTINRGVNEVSNGSID